MGVGRVRKPHGREERKGEPLGVGSTRKAWGALADCGARGTGNGGRGARGEQSRARSNFVIDAYARFRYTMKADVPEWRNGRRGGLKNRCLTTCEFDSRLGHQFSRFCKAALWVAFFILCQKADPRRNRFCHSIEEYWGNRPAETEYPHFPRRKKYANASRMNKETRLLVQGASLRGKNYGPPSYSAEDAFCFFAVATIVFTPLTASTIASTNSSTASRACSTGASAMPPVMMAVTFW